MTPNSISYIAFLLAAAVVHSLLPARCRTVFLLLAVCYVLDVIVRTRKHGKRYLYSFTGLSVLLFAAYYPVLSGMWATMGYTGNFLRWFPSWPL